MNTDEILRKALWQTTLDDIPENVNLWPRIKANLPIKRKLTGHPKVRLSLMVVIVLISLIALATVAYACYRIMIDPGLQNVENKGLVTNFNQASQPTVFAAVPTQLAQSSGPSMTKNGITVTLNWAYADENRLAIQMAVVGFKVPEGSLVRDYICKLYVSNNQHISIGSIDANDIQIQKDKPGQPILLTYVSNQHIDASLHDHLGLSMDLTIGPCGPRWNFGEVSIPDQEKQTPTPPPLIGNYHFDIVIPVNKGLVLTPNQALVVNGIRVRLETITLSPSFTSVRMCIEAAGDHNINIADSYPQVSIQAGDSPPVSVNSYMGASVGDSMTCDELGAPIPIDPKLQPIKVVVQKIYASQPGSIQPDGNANQGTENYIEGPWVFMVGR
jgi:hypothetical protein